MTHPAVEAVAKAIYASQGFINIDKHPLFAPKPWEQANEHMQYLCLEAAKAAIRALLDVPVSEGMIDAGKKRLFELVGAQVSPGAFKHLFQTMLAQLVKEVEGGG